MGLKDWPRWDLGFTPLGRSARKAKASIVPAAPKKADIGSPVALGAKSDPKHAERRRGRRHRPASNDRSAENFSDFLHLSRDEEGLAQWREKVTADRAARAEKKSALSAARAAALWRDVLPGFGLAAQELETSTKRKTT
jgi:hypothetical protein